MTDDTKLLRQVHPSFVQSGRVTSQAFRPTPKDEYRLSVYDGDMIETEASFLHYTTKLNYASKGVMAITVLECSKESLPVIPDPEPFPEHVCIDFSAFSDGSQIEKKSKVLRNIAQNRGWIYLPPAGS